MNKMCFVVFFFLGSLTTFSQDLYDFEKIPEVKITFEQADWEDILVRLKAGGKKERLSGNISIDGKVFKSVGIRYKGNSSYNNSLKNGHKKLPFNIKSDYEIEGQTFTGGYHTLKLSNVFMDPSFVREVLSYEIAREYMPAPRCNFAKVYVNEEYLGLYNNAESIDEKFLKAHFGKSGKRTFVKCDPEWKEERPAECPEGDGKASMMYLGDDPACYNGLYEMKVGGKKSWNRLIHLTEILEQSPDSIAHFLNVDAVLWMHAFNNVLVNLDSYTGRLSHNYYMYRTPDNLMTPLVWDMNLSFGGFRLDGITPRMLSDDDLQTLSPYLHYKTRNPKRPLIVKLLENTLYKKIYLGRMQTILNDFLVNGKYLERAKEIQAMIGEEVMNDTGKLYSYELFEKNLTKTTMAGRAKIIGISELMEKRTEYLSNHALLSKAAPIISKVGALVIEDEVALQATIEDCEKAYAMYRSSPKTTFQLIEIFDGGSTNDEAYEDGIYGNTVPYTKGMQYYIIAEGSRNAATMPVKAAWEFFEVE